MSRHHSNINADIAVAKAVGSALQQKVNAKADAVSLTTSRTGEIALLLGNYLAYRIDILNDEIGDRTPTQFVVKLRNRVNGVSRACDELVKTLEPHMTGPSIQERYSWFSEVVFQALDSLFDDMHRDEQDPTLQVQRRAKLRYHDPYMTDVKERTAALKLFFNDRPDRLLGTRRAKGKRKSFDQLNSRCHLPNTSPISLSQRNAATSLFRFSASSRSSASI
jgi:hypothetical protein